MKIAFFSPLAPQRSGIADYSEALLPYLAKDAEIDLFVDGFTLTNKAIIRRFQVFDYKNKPHLLNNLPKYDAVLYHMGNDCQFHTGIYHTARKFPGIVVLHDFSLQGFFSELTKTREGVQIYLDELEAAAGRPERQKAEVFFALGATPPHVNEPLKFPMNSLLTTQAEAVIVHSQWSRDRLKEIAPVTPIRQIPHLIFSREDEHLQKIQQPAQQKNRLQIASFGFITPNKGIKRVLYTLAKLRNRFDFQYMLVGEVSSSFDVRSLIRELGLQDFVKITGHVSIEEFTKRISETYIAINLREQIGGETSGSLCRIMAAGIPSIVSNAGWFAELPEDCAIKIDMDESTDALLEAYLIRLMEDAGLRSQIGDNAKKYMLANHRIEDCADQYLKFIKEIAAARPRRRFIQRLSKDMVELGIDEIRNERFMHQLACEIAEIMPSQN